MAEGKMVSLKMTPKEAKSEFGYDGPAQVGKPDLPKYPYDTKVRLGTDTLDKLGISPSDFKVGEVLTVTARVEVAETSTSERMGGKSRNSLELQITDLGIDLAKKKKEKAEDEHLNSIAGPATEDADD